MILITKRSVLSDSGRKINFQINEMSHKNEKIMLDVKKKNDFGGIEVQSTGWWMIGIL